MVCNIPSAQYRLPPPARYVYFLTEVKQTFCYWGKKKMRLTYTYHCNILVGLVWLFQNLLRESLVLWSELGLLSLAVYIVFLTLLHSAATCLSLALVLATPILFHPNLLLG